MKRITATYRLNDIDHFKQQMLNWASRFNIFIFLDSHAYPDKYSNTEWMLAAGAVDEFIPSGNVLDDLENWLRKKHDWLFGHLSYDLKNAIEPLTSSLPDHIGFPDAYFFEPGILIRQISADTIEIASVTMQPPEIFNNIRSATAQQPASKEPLHIRQRISKNEYLQTIQKLKAHILRGDCYEINFCQEFFAENAHINPLHLYRLLSQASPTPFAGFYRHEEKYLLCSSPERFLRKTGDKLVSQPIKGTIRRSHESTATDQQLKHQLEASEKDRSENVMVVDLVRNDLSKICEENSVKVEELYGIYSFPQVHQMISTVTGTLRPGMGLPDIIRATFPMGSMTGAPKLRVMELVEQYEKTKRGIYSGCIGYITPGGDFDFNVVIRSIMYNAERHYLSYQVGGGITFYSDPEKEYEECLLKAEAIKKVLQ